MLKDELKEYIRGELEQMGCKDVAFSNGEENFAAVLFNCENLISFRQETPGWKNFGIQLNAGDKDGTKRKYRIEFRKSEEAVLGT